ncbi:invertebrate-type lysozyme-like [Macrobrachium nipponense]|uniref:invertebrate-type lysozyme-like n=1 Tax=Macrobrachium nipponense TaxID=159736 RepID=UPI0030C7BBA5
MIGLKIIIFLCVVMAMTNSIIGQNSTFIDEDCFQCLCEGATGCNSTAGCQSTYHGAEFCGPFHISWQYWLDAGSPSILDVTKPTFEDFKDCANDFSCAATIVRNYLQKLIISKKVDCNGDGEINCIDFALTHKLGGYNCHQKDDRPTKYYGRFYACWNNTGSEDYS